MQAKHIGIFGKRNAGKSSLINTLMGEDVAIVSSHAGTTTDPVKKRMEIFGIGPVQLIDTAGLDDIGELGEQRVKKTKAIFAQIDMGIILFTGNVFGKEEKETLKELKKREVPVLLIHNQSDIVSLDADLAFDLNNKYGVDVVEFSCCMFDEQEQKEAVEMVIAFMVRAFGKVAFVEEDKQLSGEAQLDKKRLSNANESDNSDEDQTYRDTDKFIETTILEGMVNPGDNIVLVCPIDAGAPTGRLILPQVMAIRDILDRGGVATVLQPSMLANYLAKNTVNLVVTDSQVFKEVSALVPDSLPLTSFSILLARSKGAYNAYIEGARKLSELKAGDEVLILESCSHHKSCDDIGRVKLPKMIQQFAGVADGDIKFTFISGLDPIPGLGDSPDKNYTLAIQCGGCMVTHKQLINRVKEIISRDIPITNYGMAIAYVNGLFEKITL